MKRRSYDFAKSLFPSRYDDNIRYDQKIKYVVLPSVIKVAKRS